MKPSIHKDLITSIHKKSKNARKSDLWLIWELLEKEGHKPEDMSVRELFKLMQNDFPGFETIRRTRQKIMETNPALKEYDTKKLEQETKEDLRQQDLWYNKL